MRLPLAKLLVFVLLILLSLLVGGAALAQADTSWCAAPDGVTPVGCAEVSLYPAALTGNFSVGETALTQAANPGRLVLTPGSARVDVRGIQSAEPGFGTLFVYADANTSVYTQEGRVSRYTVYPRKTFIRGTLNLTCDIRNAVTEDQLGCKVTIDGIEQPDILAPGAKHDYYLDPGAHTAVVAVTGTTANLWTPASQELKTNIWAGGTSYLRPRFDKMGHLFLQLNQPGVLADYYVDGTQVATQAAAANLWVAPFKTHRVEAKNFTDPAANGVYTYRDAVNWAYLNPGQERTTTFLLTKQYIKGFLSLTCDIDDAPPGTNVNCQPYIDNVVVTPIPLGGTMDYPVTPGAHAVRAVLGPENEWQGDVITYNITIYAGVTTRRTLSWTIISEPGPGAPPSPPLPAPPPSSGMGTVAAVNATSDQSGCRFSIVGNGGVTFVDAPNTTQLPAGTYAWQAFFGPKGETGQFGFTLLPGATCTFTCYDEYANTTCW